MVGVSHGAVDGTTDAKKTAATNARLVLPTKEMSKEDFDVVWKQQQRQLVAVVGAEQELPESQKCP